MKYDMKVHLNPRACIVANDRLIVFGGQEGDFMPKPGSPIFKCSRRIEVWKTPHVSSVIIVGHFDLD